MDRFDLTTVEGRLSLVDHIFTYPDKPYQGKHGPYGYDHYESYRDWLRDEFSYRCAFTLFRDTWSRSFHIDHLIPQTERPDLVCNYGNLVYLEDWVNLRKGKKHLPDLSTITLSKCLFVHVHGERIGEIEAKSDIGELIIRVLKLDHDIPTNKRRDWLGILRSVAQTDELLFRKFVGYPDQLPNLGIKRVNNERPQGIELSAYRLKEKGILPEWI